MSNNKVSISYVWATIHHNHNYNKILESDWFLACPIFYQIEACAAKVSNNKVSISYVWATIHHNHNYNKILESDWFLACPIFYQIEACAAKVSNNKVSNNKVSNNKDHVLRMRALFIWFLFVTKYSLIFLKPSASRMFF